MLHNVTYSRGRRPNLMDKLGAKIKKRIVACGPEGISQKVLCKELDIPRMAAYRYCKRLEGDKEIRVIREGRGARYIAKSKIVMDPEIGAFVQGRQAYFKIIRKRHSIPMIAPDTDIHAERLTDLELSLFNFSNTLGALLTYVLLQAMSQANPILYREYHRKGPYHMSNARKDHLIKQWIEGFVSGILLSTPNKFRDLLYEKTGHYPTNFEDRVKLFAGKKSMLSIDDPEVVGLGCMALHRIYPGISYALDRISMQLPRTVESEKASLEEFEKNEAPSLNNALIIEAKKNKKRLEGKQVHTHQFRLLDVKTGVKYLQCEICHRKKSEPTITSR